MSGPAVSIAYHSDDGNTYGVLTPTWQNTIAGNTAATGQGPKPTGMRPRYRMVQDPATHREWKVKVGQITSAAWTAAVGASAGTITVANAVSITGALYMGRIGERALKRG